MDIYNPLYNSYNSLIHSLQETLNNQNKIYGAQHWYPAIQTFTPKSYLMELSPSEVQDFMSGVCLPSDFRFRQFVEHLIRDDGYHFVKSAYKSAHAFKPIESFDDFADQMTNANVIMSFRRYNCNYLFFREWTEMDLECRVYVYKNRVQYIECYRDEKQEFKRDMFTDILKFVQSTVVNKLKSLYRDFTADVYYNRQQKEWQVVEINSPFYLKAGVYLLDYQFQSVRDRIHEEKTYVICMYTNRETGQVMEIHETNEIDKENQ